MKRTPQSNTTLPNQLPVAGVLPFDITLTPGAQNTTVGIPANFPFKSRQFNATLPNQLPVEGVLPLDITLTPGAQNTTVGVPAGFPFKLKRDDDTVDDGVFNFSRHAHLPIFTKLPWLVPDNDTSADNDTASGFQFKFKRDDDDESGVFNFSRHAHLPIFTKLPWLVPTNDTGDDNSTTGGFPFDFGSDNSTVEARQFNFTLPNKLPVEGTLPFGLNVTGQQNSTVGVPSGFPF